MSAAAQAALGKADELRKAGNDFFSQSQYEKAMERYTQALGTIEGSSTEETALATKCLNNRAACACQLQQYRAAIADCTKVLVRAPRDVKALMRRGFAYESIEKYTEAIGDMRAVVAVEPSPQASAACIRLEKFARQQASLQAADAAAAAKSKGKAAEGKAAPAQPTPAKPAAPQPPPTTTPSATPSAASAPAKSAAKQPEAKPSETKVGDSEAAAQAAKAKERGTAALKRGEYKAAAEAYRECTKLCPADHAHFSNLSLALLKFGQPTHAATAARRCTELAPEFAKGHFRLGQALRAQGEPAGAVVALEEALTLAQRSGGKEATEVVKELAVCKAEASKAAAAASKASTSTKAGASSAEAPKGSAAKSLVSPVVQEVATEGASAPPTGTAAKAAPKKVDLEHAKAMARRAAEIAAAKPSAAKPSAAGSTAPPTKPAPPQPTAAKVGGGASSGGPRPSLSAFERALNAAWRGGKGSPAEVRTALSLVPTSASEMVSFVGEGLTEELFSGLLLGTQLAEEPPAVAASRLCHLTAVRRFEMCSMFVGAKEKAAAKAVLTAAAEAGPAQRDELVKAASKYGVKL